MGNKNKKVVAEGLDKAFGIGEDNESENANDLSVIGGLSGTEDFSDEALLEELGELGNDYEFIKKELRLNVARAKKALNRALEIQGEDEKARNTEVVADMIDSINSCLKELGMINKIETELAIKQGKLEGESSKGDTNNILVVGNTSEILKQLTDNMQNGKKD